VTLAVKGNTISDRRFSTIRGDGVSQASTTVDGSRLRYTVG
jgi:hypothetical protein